MSNGRTDFTESMVRSNDVRMFGVIMIYMHLDTCYLCIVHLSKTV